MNQRSSLFCAGPWPFIIIPLILLAILLYFRQDAIEQDVKANTLAALSDTDAAWAEVTTFKRGRDVLLTGEAPDQVSVDAALKIAKAATGVRIAHFAGDITESEQVSSDQVEIELSPPTFSTIVTGDSIVLRGRLGSSEAIESLLKQTAKAYGADKVLNKLSVAENIAPLPNVEGLMEALKGKAIGLGTLSANLADNTISLNGEVADTSVKNEIIDAFQAVYGDNLIDQLSVAAPIENNQCEEQLDALLMEAKINFESASAIIDQASIGLLDRIESTSRLCPEAQFDIEGHTDSTGSQETNKELSLARAQAVVDYLVDAGLSGDRFSAVGYGSEQPIADNATQEGRAQNRRIEFKLKN